ncbi:MAG: ATP-binding protein [Mariprofundus sp.]|nr:ATP-binding protein [Mariprofundus sp.]
MTPAKASMTRKAYQDISRRIMPGNIAYLVLFLWMLYATTFLDGHPFLVLVSGTIILLVSLVRYYLGLKLDRFSNDLNRWCHLFSTATLIIAATWSALSVYAVMAGPENPHYNDDIMLIAIQIFAIVIGGMNVLAIIPSLWGAFLFILSVPIMLSLFIIATHATISLGLLFLLGVLFMHNVGKSIYADYWQRLRNESMLEQQAESLALARDEALAATDAKSAFLANMSHEIRTPMNGVLGMTELLLSTTLSKQQQSYAGIIQRSGKALLKVINDILDFSKNEAGKLVLLSEPFCPRTLIEDVSELLSEQAVAKNIELNTDLPEALPSLLSGDALRLQQVLINLISNAVKFTASGKVIVGVRILQQQAELIRLDFSVKDSGIGIAPEKQQLIFTAFAQSDVSSTRDYGGTGLGLSICTQLVSAMDGEIRLESSLGQGSTFSFALTFPIVKKPTETPPVQQQPVAHSSQVNFSQMHILLAEDNAVNRLVATAALERIGCRVSIAEDGQQALTMYQSGDIDLILMDCSMPVMDGYTATSMIRQQEQQQNPGEKEHIPIIALTAHVMPEDRERCLQAGMDAYLSKPFSREQLREQLALYLPAYDKTSSEPDA